MKMQGIRIVGTPEQVANATKVLAQTFKGATLAEVIQAMHYQKAITEERKLFGRNKWL